MNARWISKTFFTLLPANMEIARHIFLTGFMGSGKSTAGKRLAALLNRSFTDLDQYIEEREKKSISDIFGTKGESYFRGIEKNRLHELLALDEPQVISLGGGTVCFFDNLQQVLDNGILVYIELSPAALAGRLKHSKTPRPLLQTTAPEELVTVISQLLADRKKFYEQAHITVNGLNLEPQHILEKLIAFTEAHSR